MVVKEFSSIISPSKRCSIKVQIEEANGSFPFYLKPKLELTTFNNEKMIPEFSYTLDSINFQYQVEFDSPSEIGSYSLNLNFEASNKTVELGNINLRVVNESENSDISRKYN